eukprot:537095-Pelagomonas_calceolata.AAC.8
MACAWLQRQEVMQPAMKKAKSVLIHFKKEFLNFQRTNSRGKGEQLKRLQGKHDLKLKFFVMCCTFLCLAQGLLYHNTQICLWKYAAVMKEHILLFLAYPWSLFLQHLCIPVSCK